MILPSEYLAERLWQRRRPAVLVKLIEPGVSSGDVEYLVVQLADGIIGGSVAGIAKAQVTVHQLEEPSSEDVDHHNGRLVVGAWLQE